ncbi:RagB/SusD family nutrient uptake outer membrane protein [Olivibacter sp. SDN3]|uniref:RagB/SusD family nutrient uptake outer membrane protein n=1 Tax=Olivibacter sp. SDN3 TaxID=2764720 RepID=UPI0016512971|nr:RagB/SusD family nutrient uptake outer membrane protein [Olivibacter sp. SDN3]QNL50181.1 RagB/SusD family nutrient uptake outer membrane protein [Olivibacter sp. SDN3]
MNRKYILSACLVVSLTACTKLDIPIESELTPENFPDSPESFVAATGPVYTQFRERYAVDYWRLQELSTEEAIIPARDGNYDDGGQYRMLHKHNWTPDHPTVRSVWEWGFGGIQTCNRIINMFEQVEESETRNQTIGEMRAMRSLFYFFMMDLYGNVPLFTTFGSTEQPVTSSRTEVFNYIESELLSIIPDLSTETGQIIYGRPNRWTAYVLLQKLYLNAEYYTGTPRYNESVEYADKLLEESDLALVADFLSLFMPDNGPNSETILAVPYDANVAQGNQFSRFGLHTALEAKYELPFRPSIALSTVADFYALFDLDGDRRNETWLAGQQFDFGGNPILIRTTNRGLDATYNGPNPTQEIDWHLEFTPEMPLRNVATMDVGNDQLGQARGVRSVKFYPDKNTHPSTRDSNNDVPVFRLADVYLMKAEAILRGASASTARGELQTADVLVNKIRERVGAPLVKGIILDELLEERGREFAWEAWRRNDLIRFGKFEGSWAFNEGEQPPNYRIYPVPTSEMRLNTNLVQNPGY